MTATRTRRLEFEAARHRVVEGLRPGEPVGSSTRRAVVTIAAAALFALTFAARLAINDPAALLANFYVVPIALLAIEFGTRAGVLGRGAGAGPRVRVERDPDRARQRARLLARAVRRCSSPAP